MTNIFPKKMHHDGKSLDICPKFDFDLFNHFLKAMGNLHQSIDNLNEGWYFKIPSLPKWIITLWVQIWIPMSDTVNEKVMKNLDIFPKFDFKLFLVIYKKLWETYTRALTISMKGDISRFPLYLSE